MVAMVIRVEKREGNQVIKGTQRQQMCDEQRKQMAAYRPRPMIRSLWMQNSQQLEERHRGRVREKVVLEVWGDEAR